MSNNGTQNGSTNHQPALPPSVEVAAAVADALGQPANHKGTARLAADLGCCSGDCTHTEADAARGQPSVTLAQLFKSALDSGNKNAADALMLQALHVNTKVSNGELGDVAKRLAGELSILERCPFSAEQRASLRKVLTFGVVGFAGWVKTLVGRDLTNMADGEGCVYWLLTQSSLVNALAEYRRIEALDTANSKRVDPPGATDHLEEPEPEFLEGDGPMN